MLQILVRRPLLLVLLAVLPALAGNVDSRIHQVKTIFVAGNNQDADAARKTLSKAKTCLALSTKFADADAILDVQPGNLPPSYAETVYSRYDTNLHGPSATLKLKSGDVLWSKSDVTGGTEVADGEDVVRQLTHDACSKGSTKRK